MSLLHVDDLTLVKDGRTILDAVNLQMSPGSFQLVIGPNGAGKSSLLKCILGIWTDFSGRVMLQGRDVADMNQRERARNMAYVPQTLDLNFNLDVGEFMQCARFAYDEPGSAGVEIIREAMSLTETEYLRDAFLDEISGGERQRVLIAAALVQEPKLLILDEPGNFLDPKHRLELARLLKTLYTERELAILMVSHDWNPYLHLGPSIMGLKQGRRIFLGAWGVVRENMAQLFDCEFEFLEAMGQVICLPRHLDAAR